MLRPGGILVTCSCSYHVSQSNFLEMLAAAALDAHRTLRLIEVRGQAKDHPVLLNVPETAYLKCVIAYCNLMKIRLILIIDNDTLNFYASFTLTARLMK